MTNQMKLILKINLIFSGLSFVLALILLFVGSIGFLEVLSYVILGVSLVIFIVNLVIYLNTLSELRALKQRIAYFKLLQKLRNDAIIDFYHRFGLTPQYDKNGKLITPDELLGILTKLDAEGKLDITIYERLGILPKFDSNGKEIPIILVLKHMIRAIKLEGLKDLKKLKGLYLKGSKKEKSKETKKTSAPAKKAEGKKKKGGSKSKTPDIRTLFMGKKKEKKKDKKKGDKKEKKSDPKKETPKESNKTVEQPVPEPVVTKIDKNDLNKIKNNKSDYLSKIYSENNTANNNTSKHDATKDNYREFGEVTSE